MAYFRLETTPVPLLMSNTPLRGKYVILLEEIQGFPHLSLTTFWYTI